MRAYSRQELAAEAELLVADFYCKQPYDLAFGIIDRLKPRDQISTLEWAEKNRKFRSPEGGALIPYDRWRTPYNIAKMEALDDPEVELVVVVKPSRSGGTTVAENYLGRMIDYGPMGGVGWYLGSDDAVKKYCDRIIKPMFEDHPELAARLGSGKSDNNDASKRIDGHLVEWLSANDNNFRNREFIFGVMDEPDGWTKFSESPETQLTGRQKQIGSRKKGIIMSHPDKGWTAGTAAAYESSSRGIYVMRCADCGKFASAHSTKLWATVPQFKLFYSRDQDLDFDKRLAMAENTAGMLCPHCGSILSDEQRHAMNDEAGGEGWWMHRGQELHADRGILEIAYPNKKRGFYDHGLMLKVSTTAELAKGLEEVLIKYERSRGAKTATKALREYMSKQLGEIFEGKTSLTGLNAETLRQRTKTIANEGDDRFGFEMGECPKFVRFITCYVDVGHHKLDIMFRGWDLERRSWVIDRYTKREHNGRELDLVNRQGDYSVLDEVIQKTFPIQGASGMTMPIAAMMIDSGDGNVKAKVVEYVRSRARKFVWKYPDRPGVGWQKIWCAKGFDIDSPHLAPSKELNVDDFGKALEPHVRTQNMGVTGIKDDLFGNDDGFGFLAIEDGSPGQIYFPTDFQRRHYDEIFAEPKIEGKYERGGRPNETLDLLVGTEAARLLLAPDKEGRDWTPGKEPIWARPVSLTTNEEGGDLAVAGEVKAVKPKKDYAAMIAGMDKG